MARNKYPEETVNKILDVSMQLFLEKGYEHTSIQDIVNHLGGLSKGAIYHHFKSKEDILDGVMNKLYQNNDNELGSPATARERFKYDRIAKAAGAVYDSVRKSPPG